jgi:SAM-dependent methyltransferase
MTDAERMAADYARREAELPPERYAFATPSHLFIRQTVERALLDMLVRADQLPLADQRILDVGCGPGQWLADLETYGAGRKALAGIDVLPERVKRARERLQGADIRQGEASVLPWRDGSFDLVLQSMMFTSILDPDVRVEAAREMARVLAPDGVVLWYDFFVDSPGNPGARRVSRAELASLFPGFRMDWRRVTLAPPLVRLLVPGLRPLAHALQGLRVANTHAMATLRRA